MLAMLEILFQYGSITIKTFNIILALSFLFTGAFIIKHTTRQKLNLAFLSHYILYIFLAVLVVGRLFYVIENWAIFKNNLLYILFIWDLHFSIFGIIVGFAVSTYILAKKSNEDFWEWFDTGILATIFAMIFIHVGHFFSGTQYGAPTDLLWGISFDTTNIPFVNPIHPTQLYAALFSLILFVYSVKKSRRIHLSGVVGSMTLMLYSLGMLGIDFLHGAPSLYVKVAYGVTAALSFIFLVHCSHKKHNLPSQN
ncbi:prolipoprotein diacylglyceryl transferase [Patescibacteria group bacterium]|nr:prolipoprotein diacylglyceryl transferase [Patescibacteria group bacterium]